MRKLTLVAICVLVLGTAAMAEQYETKWHCSKPAENPVLKVGDVPGHSYALAQGTCEAKSSNAGEKSGAYTEFNEGWKTSYTGHGRFNVTTDNGDMLYYTYERSGAPADKKGVNNWKLVGGTGKHKGIKGSGTCPGTFNDDGTSDWECTGTTTMGK